MKQSLLYRFNQCNKNENEYEHTDDYFMDLWLSFAKEKSEIMAKIGGMCQFIDAFDPC